MVAKGHCMYDVDADVGGFYGVEAAEAELEGAKAEYAKRLEGLRALNGRKRDSRFAAVVGIEASVGGGGGYRGRYFDEKGDDDDDDDDDSTEIDLNLDVDSDTSTSSPPPPFSQNLITPPTPPARARARTQGHQPSAVQSQLSQLRESDRRSLQHLPTSQQRALLATQHKQMEKGGRAAKAKRGALESAGNYFGRLGTVRLVRMPPHTGRVQSLKH